MISRATRAGFRKYIPNTSEEKFDNQTFFLESLRDDIDAFAAVLLAALPQLLLKTRHVAELWESVMGIWGIIFYSTYPLQFIYASQSESHDAATVSMPSSTSSGTRFHLDLKALKIITQEILMMPAAHVIDIQPLMTSEGQKVKRSIKSRADRISKDLRQRRRFCHSTDFLRPELQQALPYDVNTIFDSSLCKSSNHDINHHHCSRNGHCQIQILIFSNVFNAVKSRGWCTTISLSEKYVLLAAYLASTNRKESDDNVFAGKQLVKRRKIAAGHDEVPECEAVAALTHIGPSSSLITRTFTLDRLVSIFGQISSTGGVENLAGGARAAIALGYGEALSHQGIFTAEQIATSYGDSDLFGTVSSLNIRGMLQRTSIA